MSGLRGVWLVAQREIRERARARTFLLSTAFVVALAFGGVAASTVLPDLLEDEPPVIAVVSTDVNDTFSTLLAGGSLGTHVEVRLVGSVEEATDLVRSGEAAAAFSAGPTLAFREQADPRIEALVAQAYRSATLPELLDALDLTLEDAQPLISPEPLPVTILQPADPEAERGASDQFIGSAAVIVLLMALTLYGNWILNGVIEEKSSRVVEVLMGALRPWQLLTGKVLGILTLAMGQLAATIAATLLGIVVFDVADIPTVGITVGVSAVVYLVLGLLLYSFVFAAAGSTGSRQEDAQSVAMPLTFSLTVIYLVSLTFVIGNADSLFARVLSIVPVSSPLAMTPRIAVGDPPLWEIALSIALLVATIPIVIALAGRIYAGAILRSGGARVGLREAWRSSRETR